MSNNVSKLFINLSYQYFMMKENIQLEVVAERYPPHVIDEIEVVDTMKSELERMVEGTGRLVEGYITFYAIYVEGLYGSGKTLLMRKYCNEILKKFDKTIPIYFYLGEQDFLPFIMLENYYNDVKSFVEQNRTPPSVVGEPDLWKGRVEILGEVINEIKTLKVDRPEQELEKFFKALEVIDERGYYPVIIFDEFERVLLTGDGLRSDGAKTCFAYFSSRYLEIVRGQLFKGAFALVTTFPLIELLRRAIEMDYPHLREIEHHLGLAIREKSEQYPMLAPHVIQSYDEQVKIAWNADNLNSLAEKYGLAVDREVIEIIAKVLPTPRAIINIAREALNKGIKEVKRKDFIKIVEPRFDEFKKRLEREKVNGRFIIQPQTRWHEIFEILLREGMFEISRDNYLEVAKILNIEYDESDKDSVRKARQKVSNILKKLSSLQLYEATGKGIYRLNSYLLAYLLGIERLPTGESTSLDKIMEDIKQGIIELRRKSKKSATD